MQAFVVAHIFNTNTENELKVTKYLNKKNTHTTPTTKDQHSKRKTHTALHFENLFKNITKRQKGKVKSTKNIETEKEEE